MPAESTVHSLHSAIASREGEKETEREKGEVHERLMATFLLRRNLLRVTSHSKVSSYVLFPEYCSIKSFKYATERIVDVGQPTCRSHPELLSEGEITPGIPVDEYISRRKKLIELLPERSLAIIASTPVKMMTDIVPYSFRQDADYLYITGCLQPGGVAVITGEHGLCLFVPDPDPHNEAWQGPVAGVDAALSYFKADESYPMSKLPQVLSEMIDKASKVFHNTKTVSTSYTDLESFQRAFTNGAVKDLSRYTHELRWIKSPSELKLMRQSASIACQSLLQTMLFSRSNPEESHLSAKIEYECRMRGAQRMAFSFMFESEQIQHGDLVLMDVGCEFHGYLSDLTRTWPPCGDFSFQNYMSSCLRLTRNVSSFVNQDQMLRRGCKKIGILKDERSYAYYKLNPTSIGHYLGMDIHDCASISNNRPLQPGVVITIEPGLYIPVSFNAPERFRGVGIRIEDEVLISETGCEVLTASMPKEISHIKSLLNFDSITSDIPCLRAALT
ncbi:probable Xaa-Pro aminopeptidase 3 isoform X2 [Phalaenopsis equestris]|uniref:probable Xaa-Pro aminopeptidase 3 isoform X2 n=1 Tax=Phalaenopsis equestris TaxID=78828 RepID=UPI0009E425FD|nr:probable Xaa-Pro aminopeptidase 3 isoform X2 [Phalaenopsis equestris]